MQKVARMESVIEPVIRKIGPFVSTGMSFFALCIMYLKRRSPRSAFGRYKSADLCLFYQSWVHLISNVVYLLISNPFLHDYMSCDFRKWLVFYFGTITLLSQFPSILDCAIRVNYHLFYEQFHSVSSYTHLLMIVMCTWAPWLTTVAIKDYFHQGGGNFVARTFVDRNFVVELGGFTIVLNYSIIEMNS